MNKRDSLMLEYNPDDFIKVSAERAKERIEETREDLKKLEERKQHLLEDLEIVQHEATKELIKFELSELEWNIDCDKSLLKELEELVAQHEKKLEVE